MATSIFPCEAAKQPVVQRLHKFPGCAGYVLRWFIVTDQVPRPYCRESEALAELQRRQATGA